MPPSGPPMPEAPSGGPQSHTPPAGRPSGLLAKVFPNPGHYGWKIVLTGFLACAFSSPGQTFIISLYLEPLIEHLGVGRVAISSVYAGATLAAALSLPLVGLLADKLSARLFFFLTIAGIGLALLALPFVLGLATLAVLFYALRLLGQGAIQIGAVRAAALWFTEHRGRAIAIVGLGFAFGELAFPGLVQGSINLLGWQGSLLLMAALYIVVLAPLLALPMREPPPEEPAGATAEPEEEDELRAGRLKPILLSLPFWILVLGVSLVPFVSTGLIFHQVALVKDYGWRVELIPGIFATFALFRIATTYASGLLFERLPSEWNITLSGVALIAACGVVFLPGPAAVLALGYGAFLGTAAGISSAGNAILWPDRYGVAALGRLQGTVGAVRNGATAAAPPLAAWLAASTGSFTSILGGVVACSLAVGLLPFVVWHLDRRRRLGRGGTQAA